MKIKNKPKLAVIDLTDCEGCQVEFFSLEDKFPLLWQKFNIVSWRLAQDENFEDDIDIALIEGTPITEKERKEIKKIRENADLIGTLGTCADLGGINAILKDKKRDKAFKKVYNKNKPIKREVEPLAKFINIDFRIPGCPIRPKFLAKVLGQILKGKLPEPKPYPVCFECKKNDNSCLLLNDIPCLGPITAGGCKAICPSQGYPCLGCFGKIKKAQIPQMKRLLKEKFGEKKSKRILKLFLNNQIKEK